MPKIPPFTLAWAPERESYELFKTHDRQVLKIAPDSPSWFSWLEQVSSFAFVGQNGHYTARKEAKQRGDRYWSAYLATGEHLTKKYLGKTTNLTLARLEQVAGVLKSEKTAKKPTGQVRSAMPPSARLASAKTYAELEDTRRSLSVQRDILFHPLLVTKLNVPPLRAHLVNRPHLVERLQQGMVCSLTLVSAPAGFGKTTLLVQWLMKSDIPVAWLSLEPNDNDPSRFLSYLIAALQTLDAEVGTTALAMLQTPQPASPEVVLAVLTNDLVGRGRSDYVLVLDDYHVIIDESIQRAMTYLLEHLPPQFHLVLATRADPPLPLARLRAQGQLAEVRAANLRFDTGEVSTFFEEVMGLELEATAVATLLNRTEGWIAGLQLAALSLQGRADISGFLAAFNGSHRYVLDYLSEEVIAQQSAPVQQFLLHTCILERLNGPLCDAVTAQDGSQAMLEGLERANLFVVALDDRRGWYRYHHLFAEVLRSHVQQAEPALLPVLHRRACAWYEQHHLLAEAVRHTLAVPDVEHAARLIEPNVLPMVFQGQTSTVLRWMNALPQTLVRTRPLLCVYYARLLTFTNQLEAAEARLQDAERGLQEEMPAEQVQTIRGNLLTIRASIALFSGDILQAYSLAQTALELLPKAEVILRAGALATTTRIFLVNGDVTTDTEHAIVAAVASIRASNNLISTVSSTCMLARLYLLQGRLRQAAATYAQVMKEVPSLEMLQTMFTGLFYNFGLGDLLRECNDLEVAELYLLQGIEHVKETLTLEPFVVVLGYTALARLKQARGNSSEALEMLDALARLAEQRHFAPHLMISGAAVRAQLQLAQDNLEAAIKWADASGLSTEDEDLPYSREGEYLTLARVRIAQARDDPRSPILSSVLHLLERLFTDAEDKARLSSMLEILVLRALALQAQGEWISALSSLERVLVLAAPEGYIRLFVDEGEPMLDLLRIAQTRSSKREYVTTLLRVFGEQHDPKLSLSSSSLMEPLTGRESEVLRLLLEGASNHEIASRLVLSVNTVKRHVYNIYGKLGVQSRTQAIIRARVLNLL